MEGGPGISHKNFMILTSSFLAVLAQCTQISDHQKQKKIHDDHARMQVIFMILKVVVKDHECSGRRIFQKMVVQLQVSHTTSLHTLI